MPTKCACMRWSAPSSGWNDVASRVPCWTATILPVPSPGPMRASTSTSGPTSSTQGARMKTAWNGPPARPATSRSASNESTWRPKALRRTVMSMPPRVCWSSRPPSTRSASRIMPAHEPNTGRPAAMRSRRGWNRPKARSSLSMVVDSPPGSTMPSTASTSVSRRTGTAVTPAASSARACSRTSPCSASTPTVVIGCPAAAVHGRCRPSPPADPRRTWGVHRGTARRPARGSRPREPSAGRA